MRKPLDNPLGTRHRSLFDSGAWRHIIAALSLEERVAALEAKVEKIHREPEQNTPSARGWQRIVGIFENEPEFEEAVRLGREWRMADAPAGVEDTI